MEILVRDLLKYEKIYTISGNSTVIEAAARMAELKTGALLVGKPEKIGGIFSERDLLKRVVAMNLPVKSTKIKEVMSARVIFVEETELAYIALKIMQNNKFRHLPVINEKGLCVGVLDFQDLTNSVFKSLKRNKKEMLRLII
jgi:CBS domain-containing protein